MIFFKSSVTYARVIFVIFAKKSNTNRVYSVFHCINTHRNVLLTATVLLVWSMFERWRCNCSLELQISSSYISVSFIHTTHNNVYEWSVRGDSRGFHMTRCLCLCMCVCARQSVWWCASMARSQMSNCIFNSIIASSCIAWSDHLTIVLSHRALCMQWSRTSEHARLCVLCPHAACMFEYKSRQTQAYIAQQTNRAWLSAWNRLWRSTESA